MPLRQQETPPEPAAQEDGLLEGVIGDNVLFDLGEPDGLRRVQVRCVWGGHYRVDVFVGDNAASARIAHAYFLEADKNGKILSSCPPIARTY